MTKYNPFKKNINDVSLDDLIVLRSVYEGWHVEYKQDNPGYKKIAKAISSFANQYGGWLVFGVSEKEKHDNVAGDFPGIKSENVSNLLEDIRKGATYNVNPIPYYEVKTLNGPYEPIGLKEERSIIIVHVPIGQNAPYIHSDGRIYRRQADTSDPKPETDRGVIDLLYNRGEKRRKHLERRLEYVPVVSKGEKDNPYIHIHLFSDPLREYGHRSKVSFPDFCLEMKSPEQLWGTVSYDNFFTFSEGYIARSVSNLNPCHQLLTWRFITHNNSAMITIPLNILDPSNPASHIIIDKYMHWDKFYAELFKQKLQSTKVIDLNILFALLAGCVGTFRRLSATSGINPPFYYKSYIENAWRKIPFLDVLPYIDALENNGVPIIQDQYFHSPAGLYPESLMNIEFNEEHPDDLCHVTAIMHCFGTLAHSLGITHEIITESGTELVKACYRGANMKTNK